MRAASENCLDAAREILDSGAGFSAQIVALPERGPVVTIGVDDLSDAGEKDGRGRARELTLRQHLAREMLRATNTKVAAVACMGQAGRAGNGCQTLQRIEDVIIAIATPSGGSMHTYPIKRRGGRIAVLANSPSTPTHAVFEGWSLLQGLLAVNDVVPDAR